MAGDISGGDAKDFAKTKRNGLPNKVSESHIRACASCQHERGIAPEPGTSHGFCKRHWIAQMATVYGSTEKAVQKADEQDPESFSPEITEGLVLAEFLLEAQRDADTQSFRRACSFCDKERGIVRRKEDMVSHGLCKRHAREQFGKYMPDYDFDAPGRNWVEEI